MIKFYNNKEEVTAMKYFFGTDITSVSAKDEIKTFFGKETDQNEKVTGYDGDIFIKERLSEEQEKYVNDEIEAASEDEKNSRLPMGLRFLMYACGGVTLFLLLILFGGGEDVTVSDNISALPWLPYVIAICALVWLFVFALSKKKEKEYFQSEETALRNERLEAQFNNAYRQLHVPENAENTEILVSSYKRKKGEIKRVKTGLWDFFNFEVKAFAEDGKLCIADLTQRYEIGLDEIKEIKYIQKKVLIPSWNKEETIKSEKYKKYRITYNNTGFILKGYYAIIIRCGEEEYEIHIPPYEIDVFSRLTGIEYSE